MAVLPARRRAVGTIGRRASSQGGRGRLPTTAAATSSRHMRMPAWARTARVAGRVRDRCDRMVPRIDRAEPSRPSLAEHLREPLPQALHEAGAFDGLLRDERRLADALAAGRRNHLADDRPLVDRRLEAGLEFDGGLDG